MHTPVNKYIVTLDKKFYDSVTFQSGQVIHFDPSWNPEEYAMMRARVQAVPGGITKRRDYKDVTPIIQPGDEVLIRYDVVYAYKDQPDRDTPIYKNLLFEWSDVNQRYEEVWLCDILQIFAIIRDREYQMLNGYVLLDIIHEDEYENYHSIIRPVRLTTTELKHKAKVKAINSKVLDVKAGDIVYINPAYVMCYQIDTYKFYVVKESHILAKAT